jgi:dolichol-phosphate mannosyltransferase
VNASLRELDGLLLPQDIATETDRTLILICTYNERANLPSLIQAIGQVVPQCDILVVDDNSPDGTSDWVREQIRVNSKLKLASRSGKLGLGSAIRFGIEQGIADGYDWIVNLDADWSHDPTAIPRLLAARFDNGKEFDLVIGSRYVLGGGMQNCSWRRHLVSRCANIYTRLLLSIRTRDCSSAFRCYRTAFFSEINYQTVQCTGYGFLEEILWVALKRGAVVREVPIVYTERVKGESKISLREATDAVSTINRLFLRRLGLQSKKLR